MTNLSLSLAHQKFVQAYLRRPNAAAAYRAVYPWASAQSSRQAGPRLLKQPEVEAELNRLRELGQAAAVLDLARKRELLASIINDPEQKTVDRLRAMKLDAELAGDLGVCLVNPGEDELNETMERLRGLMFREKAGETTETEGGEGE